MRILVVEDEVKLRDGLVTGLEQRGYSVLAIADGKQAETKAETEALDLIIMDIMIEGQDGLTTCRNLRTKQITTPIIFLTARDSTEDKIAGLNAGGDDYLVKPFSFEELVSRITAIHRRSASTFREILTHKKLTVNTLTQSAQIGNTPLTLTSREYALLEYFMRHPGKLITRDELLESVWHQYFESTSNVVDVHIKNLRKKITAAYAQDLVTIWGKGYRLET
jgi:DNA-binding response OmpR family regulator